MIGLVVCLGRRAVEGPEGISLFSVAGVCLTGIGSVIQWYGEGRTWLSSDE